MPPKKNGMIDILKNVFKSKKNNCCDIVQQADMVISNYISQRRNEIILKYKKPKRLLSVLLMFVCAGIIFLMYKLSF